MKKLFSLSKAERIKSKKTIDTLFLSGKAFFVFPYKVLYLLQAMPESEAGTASGQPLQMAVSVPKRRFKRANRRNRLKRLTRETYRLVKPQILEQLNPGNRQLQLMLIYSAAEELGFAELQAAMDKMVKKVASIVTEAGVG